MEKEDNRKLRKEVKLLQELLANARQLNQEVTKINQQMEATATSITDTILPQTQKIISLKKHVAALYQSLGCSELQSWYKCLMEAAEFSYIEPYVTEIVK